MAGVYQHARGVLPPGTRIGRYELLRRLAKGGMAELYLARALGMHGFEKLVVLKLVLPHLAEDRQFSEMFLGEARLAATLDHPNIVHVTDIGEMHGEPFFVMEFVHGQDLRAILRAASKKEVEMPVSVALTVVIGAATGLHYVHEKRDPDGKFLGLVHRDVSPSNVMLSYEGGVKLVDFGIAKATELAQATRAGILKGKVNYMAPEQCDGKPLDRRADVFALGILLYETTTGRRLFFGDNDYHIMSRIVRGVFAKPSEVAKDYPEGLEKVVMRALASDPNDRYPSALALMRDIESFAQDARVSLSSVEITEFLRELFGDQPLPTFDEAEDASPTALHPDSRSAVRPIDRAAAATAELPAQTGISLVRGDKPTSVLREDSRGMVIGQGAAAPDHKTRVASGDVTPSRISTDIIDKTMRFEAPDRTVVANSAVVTERNTVAVATERNRAATLPQGTSGGHPILPTDTPSSPVPVSTLLPPIDEPLHVRPSSWIAVIAASLAGLIGIAVVASGDDDEPPPAASVEPEPVPAAAVPDATATISSPPPISSPVGTAPGPAPDPTPTVAPDSPGETAGADVVIEDDDTEGTTALDEDEGGDASTETPSRRSKSSGKRRGRSKSGTPKKKKSGGGLDSMYPGGGP